MQIPYNIYNWKIFSHILWAVYGVLWSTKLIYIYIYIYVYIYIYTLFFWRLNSIYLSFVASSFGVIDRVWKVTVKVLVPQSCSSLCNCMDYSPPGPSVHGILQARILEWVAIPFTRGSSPPRDWTWVSCIVGRFFTIWASRGAP